MANKSKEEVIKALEICSLGDKKHESGRSCAECPYEKYAYNMPEYKGTNCDEEMMKDVLAYFGNQTVVQYRNTDDKNTMNEAAKIFIEKMQRIGMELYEEYNSLSIDGIKYTCPLTNIIDSLYEFSCMNKDDTIKEK